ncbi:MAG: hypothetical protein ABIQ54_04385 [Gammaproteobacteria bacterium]
MKLSGYAAVCGLIVALSAACDKGAKPVAASLPADGVISSALLTKQLNNGLIHSGVATPKAALRIFDPVTGHPVAVQKVPASNLTREHYVIRIIAKTGQQILVPASLIKISAPAALSGRGYGPFPGHAFRSHYEL